MRSRKPFLPSARHCFSGVIAVYVFIAVRHLVPRRKKNPLFCVRTIFRLLGNTGAGLSRWSSPQVQNVITQSYNDPRGGAQRLSSFTAAFIGICEWVCVCVCVCGGGQVIAATPCHIFNLLGLTVFSVCVNITYHISAPTFKLTFDLPSYNCIYESDHLRWAPELPNCLWGNAREGEEIMQQHPPPQVSQELIPHRWHTSNCHLWNLFEREEWDEECRWRWRRRGGCGGVGGSKVKPLLIINQFPFWGILPTMLHATGYAKNLSGAACDAPSWHMHECDKEYPACSLLYLSIIVGVEGWEASILSDDGFEPHDLWI